MEEGRKALSLSSLFLPFLLSTRILSSVYIYIYISDRESPLPLSRVFRAPIFAPFNFDYKSSRVTRVSATAGLLVGRRSRLEICGTPRALSIPRGEGVYLVEWLSCLAIFVECAA